MIINKLNELKEILTREELLNMEFGDVMQIECDLKNLLEIVESTCKIKSDHFETEKEFLEYKEEIKSFDDIWNYESTIGEKKMGFEFNKEKNNILAKAVICHDSILPIVKENFNEYIIFSRNSSQGISSLIQIFISVNYFDTTYVYHNEFEEVKNILGDELTKIKKININLD